MITALAFLPLGLMAFFVHFAIHNAPFLTPLTRRVAGLHHHIHHLLHCPWCLSPYVAAPIAFTYFMCADNVFLGVLLGLMHTLAAACVAGIIGSLIPDDGAPSD